MKKRILLAVLFASLLLSSCCGDCEDTMIWDIFPVSFEIIPTNGAGDNLLELGTLDIDQILVEIDGEEIGVHPLGVLEERERKAKEEGETEWWKVWKPRPAPTRAYGPIHYYGARIHKSQPDEKLALHVGEFDGAKDYHRMKIKVTWPNDQVTEIEYSRKVRYKGCCNNDINIWEQVLLNGKLTELRLFKVVLQP